MKGFPGWEQPNEKSKSILRVPVYVPCILGSTICLPYTERLKHCTPEGSSDAHHLLIEFLSPTCHRSCPSDGGAPSQKSGRPLRQSTRHIRTSNTHISHPLGRSHKSASPTQSLDALEMESELYETNRGVQRDLHIAPGRVEDIVQHGTAYFPKRLHSSQECVSRSFIRPKVHETQALKHPKLLSLGHQ